jgi:EH domain-containing protein 1
VRAAAPLPYAMAPQAVAEAEAARGGGDVEATLSAWFAMVQDWFRIADKDCDGVVSGVEAQRFFARCEPPLPQRALAQVWALADQKREGYLSRAAFGDAMRLIALHQSGVKPSLEALRATPAHELPLPRLAGAPLRAPPAPAPAEGSGGGASGGGASGGASSGSGVASIVREWRARAGGTPGAPRPRAPRLPGAAARSIAEGLAALYVKKVRPLEEVYAFGAFADAAPLEEVDFHAKPLVLLLGQYSCGKTTFITHLLGRSFPLAVIGPEPTTDRFCVVHHGHDERSTPGHTLAATRALPFGGLARFGSAFLNKLVGSELPAEMLESITLVDTPGVLAGEKQRLERHYDYPSVVKWFAARADLVLLLFDPHKLDISDECVPSRCIERYRAARR